MVNFEIRTLGDQRELALLLYFMGSQPLHYPDYMGWLNGPCRTDLDSGYKRAYVAWSDGRVVGDVIAQPHKELPRTLELKNLRIDLDFRRRALAFFLMKQPEADARGQFEQILCDSDSTQVDIHHLLAFAGFRLLGKQHLYSSSRLDYMFVKRIGEPSNGVWTP